MSLTQSYRGALLVLGVTAGCAAAPASPQTPEPIFLADAAVYERFLRDARLRDRDRDYRAAVQSYARALAANPGDEQVLYLLARAASRAGDTASAQAWL